MRTNIEIDDELIAEAMRSTGAKTKREVVNASLRLAIKVNQQEKALQKLWGIGWEGDLKEMRQSRDFGQFS